MVEIEAKRSPDCERLASFRTGSFIGHAIIHQKRCMKCFTWLYENDEDRFNELLGRALRSKNPGIYNGIISFALSRGHKFEGLEQIQERENLTLEQIISSCSAYRLPNDVNKIPNIAGVYIVTINNKNSKKAVYIGSSLNVHLRITTHNVEELITLAKCGVEMLVYCLLFPLEGTEQAMRDTELHLIREIKPTLNKQY